MTSKILKSQLFGGFWAKESDWALSLLSAGLAIAEETFYILDFCNE